MEKSDTLIHKHRCKVAPQGKEEHQNHACDIANSIEKEWKQN